MTYPRNVNGNSSLCCISAGCILTVLATLSCSRLPDPAFSYTPPDDPEAGDTIQFLNETRNAAQFHWEFGDGFESRQDQPIHVYEKAGIYRVKLTAVNDAGEKTTEQPVAIHEPTILTFNVLDSTGTLRISGAGVSVYDDRDCFLASAEPLLFSFTDTAGRCSFRNVDPVEYFVSVVKQENSGYWSRQGSTGKLDKHRSTIYRVICTWSDAPYR